MYNTIYFSYSPVKFCFIYFANMLFVIVELLSRACQASLSMGFPKQESWSRLPFLFPGDLPNPGIKSASSILAGGFFISETSRKQLCLLGTNLKSYLLGELKLIIILTHIYGI